MILFSLHEQKIVWSQSACCWSCWCSTCWFVSAQWTPCRQCWGPYTHDKCSLYWCQGETNRLNALVMSDVQSAAAQDQKMILMSLYCSPLCQGGSGLVINSAGPLSSKNQSKRWLLFKKDIMNPAATDVSEQHCSGRSSFIPFLPYFNFNSVISLGWEESQLVWAWQNCSKVWRAFGFSATASFVQRDHLWTLSLGELSHQRWQPRDRGLWTLLQRRKQRRDEQPFDQSKLQTRIFWAGRHEPRRWAETVFSGGKWRNAEPFPPSLRSWCAPALLHHRGLSSSPADIPDSRLLTTPGLGLSPAAEAKPLLPRLFFAVQGIGKQMLRWWNVLLLRIYLRTLYECLW